MSAAGARGANRSTSRISAIERDAERAAWRRSRAGSASADVVRRAGRTRRAQRDAEQTGSWRADEDQRGAVRVADQHRRRQEVGDVAEAEAARHDQQHTGHQREQRREVGRARGIAGGQRDHDRPREQRDRRVGADDDAAVDVKSA